MASFTNKFVLAIYHNMGVMNGSVLSQHPGPEEYMIQTYVIERVEIISLLFWRQTKLDFYLVSSVQTSFTGTMSSLIEFLIPCGKNHQSARTLFTSFVNLLTSLNYNRLLYRLHCRQSFSEE